MLAIDEDRREQIVGQLVFIHRLIRDIVEFRQSIWLCFLLRFRQASVQFVPIGLLPLRRRVDGKWRCKQLGLVHEHISDLLQSLAVLDIVRVSLTGRMMASGPVTDPELCRIGHHERSLGWLENDELCDRGILEDLKSQNIPHDKLVG